MEITAVKRKKAILNPSNCCYYHHRNPQKQNLYIKLGSYRCAESVQFFSTVQAKSKIAPPPVIKLRFLRSRRIFKTRCISCHNRESINSSLWHYQSKILYSNFKRIPIQPRRLVKGFTVQRFRGCFPRHINQGKQWEMEKSEAINPEPGTRNLITQTDRTSNMWAIPQSIKLCGHIYLMKNEVWIYLYNPCLSVSLFDKSLNLIFLFLCLRVLVAELLR